MKDQHVFLTQDQGVFTIWLNRTEVRNAFDDRMIADIIEILESTVSDEACKVLMLRGKGPAFCAGADLNGMKKALHRSYEENLNEGLNLSKCLQMIYQFPKPTIAIVHGAAIGGANGLLAACDFVLTENETVFSMTEVRIGLVPACISPYVIKRIGEYHARSLMLTGRPINGTEAVAMGLANFSGTRTIMEKESLKLVGQLLEAGPMAVTQCKKLIHDVVNNWTLEEAGTRTAQLISGIRTSAEAQEGMSAFLEKRKPSWRK